MTDHDKHIETRRKLKEIPLTATFENVLELCTLSEMDKQILRLHYIEEKDFRYIGDVLGYSEKSIKERHREALRKISYAI